VCNSEGGAAHVITANVVACFSTFFRSSYYCPYSSYFSVLVS